MQIRWLAGPKIATVVLPLQEPKIETRVIATQSLEAVIAAIDDATTKSIPGILLASIDADSTDATSWRCAVQAYGIDSLRRGRARSDTLSRLGSSNQGDRALISAVNAYS
jgi:hypothetical protein